MASTNALVPARETGGPLALPRCPHYDEDKLDLSETVNFLARWWRLILSVTAAVFLIGLAISLYLPQTFRAEATVVVDKSAENADRSTPTPAGRAVVSNELIETQVAIITSAEMTSRVVAALGLANGLPAAQRQALEEQVRERVDARRAGESYALTIEYLAATPEDAATVVNEFARQYASWELGEERGRNQEALAMVRERLTALRNQAQQDTQALQQYRIANNLLSTSGTSLTEQEISNYEQEVARARASAAEDVARLDTALDQLRSGSNGDDVGEALGSQVISSLREQEALAAGQVADLSARYGPNHPELIRAQSKLTEVKSQIQSEIGRVVSNLRAKRQVSQQRLASLSGSLGSAKSKLSQNNASMVGLSDLERKAAASQGIYETYLGSYKGLVAAEGAERPGAKILTIATPPTDPVSPNLQLNLALAAITGLGLGLLVAYAAEALSQGIRSTSEVETALGENFLGSIPLLSTSGVSSRHAVEAIRDEPKSAFSECFRALSASIEQVAERDDTVIAVTSALPNEGKTVISCCLAHTSASAGMRTILIDCDLRRRGISRLLGMRADQVGLVEVLQGAKPLNVRDLNDDSVFCILPIRPSEIEPEGLLTGPQFDELISQLRGQFDRIILDLPPVLPIAATRKIAEAADSVVFTMNWRTTPKAAAMAALKRLPRDRVHVAGIVVNKVDMRRRAMFGAHDAGYFYNKYSEYYA
ncbi:GumC family protein [Altererythrobacter sp. CAU 1778]